MILGLDLAPRKCGWCAGDGSSTPVAGGFRLPDAGDDFGWLLDELHGAVEPLLDRFGIGVVIVERAILPSHGGRSAMGSLRQRRAQMCMGPHVEWMCRRRGVLCQEADPRNVKKALTGDSLAEKDAMVAAAVRLGIALPAQKVDGREDAADGVGCWLIGVEHHARHHLPQWDERRWRNRGAMF